MTFYKWSKTAASNSTADATINWAEGQAPSTVNDSARAMMAATAKYRDDISGSITTGGTSTAYTLTTNQVFTTLALMANATIAFVPHATNGATVTLAVDGLAAKPLRPASGVELIAGVLVAGSPYVCTYNNSDAVFYLQNFVGNGNYFVPIGAMIPYVGSTAPSSNFVLPYGQTISRTTYAALFTIVSTTFGVGDGVNTFNIPDLRGRSVVGKDDMGGSAASRVTTAGSSVDGLTIGATGGAQNVTLAQANLPNVTLTVTGTTPLPKTAGSRLDSGGDGNFGVTAGTDTSVALASGATSSINGNVTQTVTNVMSPTIVLPWIMRII